VLVLAEQWSRISSMLSQMLIDLKW